MESAVSGLLDSRPIPKTTSSSERQSLLLRRADHFQDVRPVSDYLEHKFCNDKLQSFEDVRYLCSTAIDASQQLRSSSDHYGRRQPSNSYNGDHRPGGIDASLAIWT